MSTYIYSTAIKVSFDKKLTSSDPISTNGWTVSALEPDMSPDGILSVKEYLISKITKTDDDFALILWLDFPDHRLKYPVGDITVGFTGTLFGPEGSMVSPFEISFTPTPPVLIFNPHDQEHISISDLSLTANIIRIYYSSHEYFEGIYLSVTSVSGLATLTHINDLEI